MSSYVDTEPCLFVYPYLTTTTTTPLLPRYSSQHSNRRGKRGTDCIYPLMIVAAI
jgi:hypothetical protein